MSVLPSSSKHLNFFAAFCAVVVVCASTKIIGRNRNVQISDDIIVFPTDDSVDSKEKRSGHSNYREFEQNFRHDPEFHKLHNLPPPFSTRHNSPSETTEKTDFNNFTSDTTTVPLGLIQNINQYSNVTEVLLNFVDGEIDDDGKVSLTDRFGVVERNAAVTPKSAGCMPELQTVNLASSQDASVLYIPQCTRIERCGGCCSHHLLSCQPTEVKPVSFSVMKTQYVGGQKLKFVGKEIIVVEKHTKCKCDCKIKEEDCNRFQQYRKSECRCACINTDEEKKCYRKNQTKLWDPELCSCVCREVTPCSTGYEFDPIECRCLSTHSRNRFLDAIPRSDYDEYK